MGKDLKKDSSLTIRIECKTKENLKEIASKKGLTMSELINQCLTELVENEKFKEQYKDQLENRTKDFEEKLKKLKKKFICKN
ncbi:hypothetical protein ACED96_15450 [Clostridium thermobutyricum]